jgi:hypothetical protein
MLKAIVPYGLLAVAVLGGGFYISTLYDDIFDLEQTLKMKDIQIEIFKTNAELLEDQLAFETQNEENGNAALSELGQVSKEERDRPLTPAIQNVLDGFHSRIRP